MNENKLGTVEISPNALSVIVSIAVNEVEGVSKLIGNFKNEALEKIGKKEYSKGVRLNIENNKLNVEITCSLKTGYSVEKIANKIQENVRNSIFNMTELETKSININIIAIDY